MFVLWICTYKMFLNSIIWSLCYVDHLSALSHSGCSFKMFVQAVNYFDKLKRCFNSSLSSLLAFFFPETGNGCFHSHKVCPGWKYQCSIYSGGN